jgi:hypothetical protein
LKVVGGVNVETENRKQEINDEKEAIEEGRDSATWIEAT